MNFAERLRSLRTERGITQRQLAKEVGIGQAMTSIYERGRADPTAPVICWLSDYFGVSADYLLGRTDRR